MRNITELPDDIWNLVMDYKYELEKRERFKRVLVELYYHGFLRRRPLFICVMGSSSAIFFGVIN